MEVARFGDQSLFVTKTVFELAGGYREDFILLEDQEITRRLQQYSRFRVLPAHISTPACKYRENGIFRLQSAFYLLTLLYGRVLVAQQCGNCHATDLFTDESYRNNGLSVSFKADSVRAHITGRASDISRFKVTSLRNMALTLPYMHDGRFTTLEAVLAHYDHGVHPRCRTTAGRRPAGYSAHRH